MPPNCTITKEVIASTAVTVMLLVTVAVNGIKPIKLLKRMKKNAVSNYGKNFSYPLPIVDFAISSRTKIIKISVALVTPEGTKDFL